jgi:hypothetical protein
MHANFDRRSFTLFVTLLAFGPPSTARAKRHLIGLLRMRMPSALSLVSRWSSPRQTEARRVSFR